MYAVIKLERIAGAQVCNILSNTALSTFKLVDRLGGHISVRCDILIHTRHTLIKHRLELWVTLAGTVFGYFGSHGG